MVKVLDYWEEGGYLNIRDGNDKASGEQKGVMAGLSERAGDCGVHHHRIRLSRSVSWR